MAQHAFLTQLAESTGALTDAEAASVAYSKAKLPAFGRLCARFSTLIGKPELHFASPAQKSWITAARAALPAMALHGAETEDYQFLACDERPLFNRMDHMLGNRDEGCARPLPTSPAANLTLRLSSYRGGKLISKTQTNIGASRETPDALPIVKLLERHFGHPIHARIFAIGHEFGHAWQSLRDKPFVRIAAERSSIPFAKEFLHKLDAYSEVAGSPTIPIELEPIHLANALFEEACCDAIGCWALERCGSPAALRKAVDFRRDGITNSSAQYATYWLLESLHRHGGLPERFGDLTRAIAEHCVAHSDRLFDSLGDFSKAWNEGLAASRAPAQSPKP